MFKSFIAWLDSYLSREEPSAVLKTLVGLMAFASLLGTIFGNQAIRAGGLVALVVFVASTMLLLLADRRNLKHSYDADRTLIGRYCDFLIKNSSEPMAAIDTWRQEVYIHPNGDVREVVTLNVVALREKLPFIQLTANSLWNQPEGDRRKVTVTARSITAGGTPGPRWKVTVLWISTHKMTSILHFHEPLDRGAAITIEIVRTWPRKCLPLMRAHEVEEFSIQVSKYLKVQDIKYRIILPVNFDATHELIGSNNPQTHISVDKSYDNEGRRIFVWHTKKLPSWTRVGIRLELT